MYHDNRLEKLVSKTTLRRFGMAKGKGTKSYNGIHVGIAGVAATAVKVEHSRSSLVQASTKNKIDMKALCL